MSDQCLPLDAFVRAFAINKGVPHGLFLGAGASTTSGVPSAARCVWEWKRSIFVSNHPGLEDQFSELTLQSIQYKIQRWLDSQGRYPAADSIDEYGHYIERCYPTSSDRRRYFEHKVREAQPHVGYKALCALAQAGYVDAVWTTNFDSLVARAAGQFKITPIEVGIDCQSRLPRPLARGELLCVSLHGDYRYDALKNTSSELQEQEVRLGQALIEYCTSRPLIVCGYSGRDASVMQALRDGLSRPGTGALFWCGVEEQPAPVVRELLEVVSAAGRRAQYVGIQGFDDLLVRLALHCLEGDELREARAALGEPVEAGRLPRVQFSVQNEAVGGVLRSNAFEVQCPSEVLEFDLTAWPDEKVWAWLAEATRGSRVIAVPRKKVVALGTIDEVKRIFGEQIKGQVERTPIGQNDLRYEDGAIVALFRSALVRSISEARGLGTNGRDLLWERKASETRTFEGARYAVHEAALLALRTIAGRQYIIIKPTIVLGDGDSGVPSQALDGIKRAIFGWQHNAKFYAATERWRRHIKGVEKSGVIHFEWPPNCGSTFRFEIKCSPLFAGIAAEGNGTGLQLEDKQRRHITQKGLRIPEPRLLFGARQGTGVVQDTHPIRGIVRNRPFDFSLTERGLATPVRLGVVCPAREAGALAAFLANIHAQHRPAQTERDYLLDYPGFASAFGTAVEVPTPGGDGWETYQEPPETASSLEGGVALSRSIVRAIEALRAGYGPNVVLVLTPERFAQWRKVETESETFDLHDFVKAYCAPRGVATQFLMEDTFADTQRCRVWWWLALALYVKSMRTPWVLGGLDEDTAFVGLGFSVDRHAPRGRHVVLGCSHIYNSRGEGLQYRLRKIENPLFRGRNPYMSLEDARQVGEMVRQLFYEARFKLPSRVVIHKQTPFLADERAGLLQGLGGVSEVEMLEVNIDSALRYLSSRPDKGKLVAGDYPVERGTVVVLEPHTAALWVHGVTGGLDARRYYQGKRRIPAPLVVRRHAGTADLATIGAEILGLSKMNWNTFDLYTKLPTTIESSGCIARIGSRLERFGPTPYDYRLFI